MSYRGDIRLNDTLDLKFTTRRFSTGAPFALSGGTIAAYPDNSTTEITAGVTLTPDFDARTGLNHVRVEATGANGFATGVNYDLVITAGTVDSVSVVGENIGSFSIEKRSALMPTVAARTLDVAAGGEAGLDLDNTVGTLSAAEIPNLDAAITTRASSAQVTAIQADTDDIQTRLPAALVGGRIDASVGAMAANTVTAAVIATDAIDADAIAPDAIGASEFSQAAADKVWSSASRTLTAFSTALAVSVWDVLEAAITTANSIGVKVKNNLDAAITTRATPAQVNAEAVDALNVDTYAEPGQGTPAATTSLAAKINYLYKAWRNRRTQTATTFSLMNDDAVTVDQKATVSDDGVTFDRTEITTGP